LDDKENRMKKAIIVLVVLSVMLAGTVLLAGVNVSWKHHPKLAAAQKLIDKAYEKISEAQVANEFDMDGHAAKAKDLLLQANDEIKLAAEAANHNKR
jgi:Na+-transporting NADH:ubiquinone oxidoreductase subunit NqrC